MAEWKMIPGREQGEPCAEGHRCCRVRVVHGHRWRSADCRCTDPSPSPYQAVEMVAVQGRKEALEEVERLKVQLDVLGRTLEAALRAIRDRADRMAEAVRTHMEACDEITCAFTLEDFLAEHDAAREALEPR